MLGLQDHEKVLGTKWLCARQSPCHLSSILSLNQTFSSVRTINVFLSQAWKGLGAGVASFTKQWQFLGKQWWTVFSRPALGHKRTSCSKPWTYPGQIRNGQNLESMNPRGQSANLWTSGCVLYSQNFTDENFNAFLSFLVYKDQVIPFSRSKECPKKPNRPVCFYCLGRGGRGGRGEPCFSFFFFPPLQK